MASKSTILCEYYLWVRWCNIREINGYYIYNGMKGNKLSFVHQQNRKLTIYFHALTTTAAHHDSSSFTFLSSIPQSSIPENREEDDNDIDDIKLNFNGPDSPRDSSSPRFNINVKYENMSSSNSSTPCSSPPPESPLSKPIPRLSYADSMEDILANHWVIKHDGEILYYTKDKHEGNTIDHEYPPSYGWKYNEKNQSSLPKLYQKNNANDLINFGAPPPGITRIPIIPEPMIRTSFKNGHESNNVYAHGSFKNGQSQPNNVPLVPTPFDVPVHYMDIMFKLDADPKQKGLGFGIQVDSDSKTLQINNISTDCMAYKVGLKQGDIILAVNEEDFGSSVDEGLEKLNQLKSDQADNTMISMTVCRRIFDDIMIIVKSAGNDLCNGQYYFHHLDEFKSPVFMQDTTKNEEDEEEEDEERERMIIRKAHYENDSGESLWTISDKTEDYYVGLSVDTMPPDCNWESVSKSQSIPTPPTLVFYNKNQKLYRDKDGAQSTQNSLDKAQIDDVLDSLTHPSLSYNDPKQHSDSSDNIVPPMTPTTPITPLLDEDMKMDLNHYRRPSWKKTQNTEDEDAKHEDNIDWKTQYENLFENWQDITETFYTYWQFNKKQQSEIDRLKDIISQHGNRFIIIRKELFQQKRREEDLLDKINSLQTHSRQVSSISALFDDEYNLDIQELQDLHKSAIEDDAIEFDNDALDESNIENEIKSRENSKTITEKLDRIELETEIEELKVKLAAKDVKIQELEIEINSWQETHSQIYDSFTSATRIYREQVEQFNDEEKLYKEKNNDLEQHLEILREQLKSKNSTQQSRGSMERTPVTRPRRYTTDIDAELEYNSDSSSSVSDDGDSDDSIGGGAHVRRGSKPWMQIKQKMMKKHAKIQREREKEEREKAAENATRDSAKISSPPPPEKKASNHNVLGVRDNASIYLTSVPSGDEPPNDVIKTQPPVLPVSSVDSDFTIDTTVNVDYRERHTEIDAPAVTDLSDTDSNMLPTHPMLHTARGQSHVSGLLPNAQITKILPKLPQSTMMEIQFRESNISMLSEAATPGMEMELDNNGEMELVKQWQHKCSELEVENENIIASKLDLLRKTAKEIDKLKKIINAVLSVNNDDNLDIKALITQMLKAK